MLYQTDFKSLHFCFWATFCKTVRPVPSDRCMSCLCVLCVMLVHCGQTVGWIKMKLDKQVGLGWPHCVRWGPNSRSPKGAQPPIFGPYLLCPNGWIHQDVTWCGGRPRPRPHCARWGPSSPKRHTASIFGPCRLWQTAICIRIPLGTEVGLSLADTLLDGDPAHTPLTGHTPSIFGPCPLWPNGWID